MDYQLLGKIVLENLREKCFFGKAMKWELKSKQNTFKTYDLIYDLKFMI